MKDKIIQKQKTPNHQNTYKKSDYRVHKPYDKYFKNLMSVAGEGFMKLIGCPITIRQVHNTEKINEISGELHIDSLIESDEPKMYINEFQTGPISERDLRRFGSYQVLVFKETGLETVVNVISLEAKHDSDDLYGFGTYFNSDYSNNNPSIIEYGFTPHVKSLTGMDLSLYLNIMEEIVEIKKKPDEYDLAILLTVPFMTDDLDRRKGLIFKTDEIASELNIQDKNLLIDIKNNQRLLAQEVLSDEEFRKYMDVRKVLSEEDIYKLDKYEEMIMKESIRERIEAEIDEKGWQNFEEKVKEVIREDFVNAIDDKVKDELRQEVEAEIDEKIVENVIAKTALNMIKEGFSLEEISRVTGFTKDRIFQLSSK